MILVRAFVFLSSGQRPLQPSGKQPGSMHGFYQRLAIDHISTSGSLGLLPIFMRIK